MLVTNLHVSAIDSHHRSCERRNTDGSRPTNRNIKDDVMRVLSGLIVTFLLVLFPGTANASILTMAYAGFTQSNISDATNYFGLGNTIAPGNAFSLSVTFDTTVGFKTGPGTPANYTDYISQCCAAGGGTGWFTGALPGPTPISVVDIILNGKLLSFNGSLFTEHQTHITFADFNCCASFPAHTEYYDVDFTASNAQGSHINLVMSHHIVHQPLPGLPTFVMDDLLGSLSLLLLASDGTTLANLSAPNTAFGLTDPTTIPLPGALPLLAMGIGWLGVMGRRRAMRPNAYSRRRPLEPDPTHLA
jgi:hypothetical protein